MTNPGLSEIISSIVSAFENGMNVFRSIKTKSKQAKLNKKKKTNAELDDGSGEREELRLGLSLQRGPRQIMNTFETNSGRYGDRYRRGDDVAQSSLTHTLLVLNAGLMRIISSLLSGDSMDSRSEELARRSLLSLSETSACESVRCLEDLRQRLVASSSMRLPRDDGLQLHHAAATSRRRRVNGRSGKKGESTTKANGQAAQTHRRQAGGGEMVNRRGKPAVSPPVMPQNPPQSSTHNQKHSRNEDAVRGGWIRPKDSSTHTGATTSPPLRPQDNKRHNSDSSSPPYRAGRTHHAASSSPNLTRPSSNAIMPERRFSPAPQRNAAPSPGAALHQSSRKETNRVSIQSIDSGSTKLGEIPQHKWLRPWEPPAPVQDEDEYGSDEQLGQRRRVGLRFWRRFARNHAVDS